MKVALSQAVDWYVCLHDSQVTDAQRAAWQAWLAEDPRHAQAWARLENLRQRFDQAPQGIVAQALENARHSRRNVVKTLAVLLGVGLVGWQGYQVSPWSADYVTRVGERRRVTLADGSRLDLNTDTRVDIRFTTGQRLIHLLHGEILVTTAKDPRPLSVQTAEGHILALGTRFGVHQTSSQTRLTVEEHAVEISPSLATTQAVRVEAGQACDFTSTRVGALRPAAASASAWTQGMLVVVDWRLDEVLAELSRHRHGYLGCSPQVAAMRLSGAFNLNDSEATLASLLDALPIQMRRMTRYWIHIEARET
ncbi:FecR domain-containing protein [Pseudomonas berkeleyensis]|uniref:FecR domain-containing protein n=1 Tax=Pseudomonas berkeleyensis TaxID=2726956 RepID=A0A7G5DP68_9PSED|nr:FecR domain-containing protein [Pseudomonas berkeleyensis]QMV63543.1 FecR domain-containing protein [Pseudomonas berkeleyensis]WSO39009.1 FecR domain-containing protein [Pseudomonas berkeleyensis]